MTSELPAYKREFIEFMLNSEVLRFGDFTTKSGRQSPYFIDAGRYATGAQLDQLASFYTAAIEAELRGGFDVLFGPAYKGIPLAVCVAMKLAQRGRSVGFCFNRKEAKPHGEGGRLVGARLAPGARVLIIEDVTTAGTSVRETVPLLRAEAAVELVGLVVSVDRKERGTGEGSALDELRQSFGMQTFAIVDIDEVLGYLRGRRVAGELVLGEEHYQKALAYRQRYGVNVTLRES